MEELAPLVVRMLVTATALAVIVLALTQVGITTFKLEKRFKPVLSLGLGLFLGAAAMSIVNLTLPLALWVGGLAGLVASGAYDNAKAALAKIQKGDDEDDDTN